MIRVRDIGDSKAWAEFHSLYSELIYRYAIARGLQPSDAEDVRSACYEAAVKQMPNFEYKRSQGSFKGWLKTIVNRRVIDLHRQNREVVLSSHELASMKDPNLNADELWELEWKKQHLRHCVSRAKLEVSDQVAKAFQMLAEDGFSVPAVCQQLNMSANQVYKAKSQMLAKVRALMLSEFSSEDR